MSDSETNSKGSGDGSAFRIMLVDDHPLFRQSLQALLTAHGYCIAGTAGDGFAALSLARTVDPNLILMDIDMPRCDGLTATKLIKAEMPGVRIVMLTVSASDDNLFDAVKSGACGYLLKSHSADQFLEMIAQVKAGGAALPPDLAARVLAEFSRQANRSGDGNSPIADGLTQRQTEILTLVARGLTYAAVSDLLHLSQSTIRYHMAQIMERLHLANRSQVIAYAAKHGLLPTAKE